MTYIVRRLAASAVLLLVMSLLVFIGVYAIGNPVDLLISPEADQKEIERVIAALGLDKPLWQQYLIFLERALSGDLGRSFAFNTPRQKAAVPCVVINCSAARSSSASGCRLNARSNARRTWSCGRGPASRRNRSANRCDWSSMKLLLNRLSA